MKGSTMAIDKHITRRLFLGNTSAVALAATATSGSARAPDAVASLQARFLDALEAKKNAAEVLQRALADYHRFVNDTRPSELFCQTGDNIEGYYDFQFKARGSDQAYDAKHIEVHRLTIDRVPEIAHTERARRMREIVAAHDRHKAIYEGSPIFRAHRQAEVEYAAAHAAVDAVVEEIAALPALGTDSALVRMAALASEARHG
jgi:hypothetical protein